MPLAPKPVTTEFHPAPCLSLLVPNYILVIFQWNKIVEIQFVSPTKKKEVIYHLISQVIHSIYKDRNDSNHEQIKYSHASELLRKKWLKNKSFYVKLSQN